MSRFGIWPCHRCSWMPVDCTCGAAYDPGPLPIPIPTAQRLRGDEMSSRQQERAGESAERLERRSGREWEWPVLPPLTVEERRAALDPIDTPGQAARSPWWPEEAA